jgi:hypothetical protein
MLLIMQFRLICVQNDISLWFPKKINYKTYPLGNEPCIGDFTNSDRQDNMNYVGLQTPPRILTMEEAFATNGDDMEEFIRKIFLIYSFPVIGLQIN